MSKVMVAMSGGVDSSAALSLILSSGYEAIGGTLSLLGEESPSIVGDARAVAERLGVEHFVFDFSENFRKEVIGRFIAAYEAGGTPNPCVYCNRFIKFGKLLEEAEKLGCSHLATGHYARTGKDPESGRYLLKKAADPMKDQTYMLYGLSQEQLSHVLFPLGDLTKSEARKIAAENGFANADKPDSQDICFVPDGDYAGFIERTTGKEYPGGDFLDADGKAVGRHKGIIHYTIGQRKHLGLSMGRPIFVSEIDPIKNTVTVSDEDALFSRELTAHDINLISLPAIEGELRVTAKTRYSHKEAPATVIQTAEDELFVRFDEPQRAVTRGQAVVLYDGDTVVGGGTIV